MHSMGILYSVALHQRLPVACPGCKWQKATSHACASSTRGRLRSDFCPHHQAGLETVRDTDHGAPPFGGTWGLSDSTWPVLCSSRLGEPQVGTEKSLVMVMVKVLLASVDAHCPPPRTTTAANLHFQQVRVQPKATGPAAASIGQMVLLAFLVGNADQSVPGGEGIQPDSQSPLLGPSWPGTLASTSTHASQQGSCGPLQRPQYCAVTRMCHPGVLWSAQLRSLAFRQFRYRSLSAVFARILFNVARCSASVFAYARETSTLAIFAIPGLSQD